MKYIIIAIAFLIAACNPAYSASYLTNPLPRQHVAQAPIAGTATTSSAVLVASNLNRTGLNCTNLGTVSIFIAYGSNAAILNGGTVIPAGATWWMDDYLFTTQAVNVISASSANIACTEYQ